VYGLLIGHYRRKRGMMATTKNSTTKLRHGMKYESVKTIVARWQKK
jgi:hypothetical protein